MLIIFLNPRLFLRILNLVVEKLISNWYMQCIVASGCSVGLQKPTNKVNGIEITLSCMKHYSTVCVYW